jgi:hypothetical protein
MADDDDKFTLEIKGPGMAFEREIDAAVIPTVMQLAFGGTSPGPPVPSPPPAWTAGADPRVDLDEDKDDATQKKAAKKAAKKAPKKSGKKATYDVPKDINFAPTDRQTLAEYSDEKKPKNNVERALVAVYYITKVLERPASVGAVIAAFKFMGWPAPADPANNLQKAGSEHWLETSDSNNITVVYGGDNQLSKMPKSDK